MKFFSPKMSDFMRRIFLWHSIISIMPLYAYEPRGRVHDIPDIDLPSENEVVTGLIITVIAIPIGYLILSNSKNSTLGGLIGTGFIGAGIITLLPTLTWLCNIIGVLVYIGFLLFIIIIAITLIYNLINKK